ncbi:Teichoic acid translocation permease protein TagG [Hartmannibacter diazotrophicus]|uniref:Transport permease protein n=1 Tax=Hartmannibacter diazotrophicus TaxID=1482074 RepID=A0A2C9D290_9HYPH|nr:ABC transporter permease [Hartmannibacter diazotrophicus]SON53911.1 Teichoic acid translocation permease protein TagG [Hartmannibacter diazotrophicus]
MDVAVEEKQEASPALPHETLITAGNLPLRTIFGELFGYRDLVRFFIRRDLKVRYRQTFLGVAWIVVQPFVSLVLFTVVFGRLAGMPSDGLRYEVFAISGLVIWTFFANGLTNSANSVVNNAALVSKVYFPRLAIPIAAILSGLVDLLIASGFMLAVLVYYGVDFSMRFLLIVPLTGLAIVATFGVGFILSGLNVLYRDVRHLVPFLTQAWFFATPVVYPLSLFPEGARPFMALNPMVGVLEGFRWAVGASSDPWSAIGLSCLSASVLAILGVLTFTKAERRFADVI